MLALMLMSDWDENREIKIKSLAQQSRLLDNPITKVSLLGCDNNLVWKQEDKKLSVALPDKKPCEHA